MQLAKRHLTPHAYADDTQIYGYCQPSDAGSLIQQVSVCTDEVSAWMKANRLQLNPAKTEVFWCASSRRQHQIPTGPVGVGDAFVSPVTEARDLGVYIDAGVTMRTVTVIRISLKSPGILTIINGPEHDELSLVYSHLSCITWGPTCQLYP